MWNKKTKNPYKFAIKNSSHFILTSDSTMYTDHYASCSGSGISNLNDYSAVSCVEAGGTWYSCTRNYWTGSMTTVSDQ